MRPKKIFFLILCILFTISHAYSEEPAKGTIILSLPELSWAVEINAADFAMEKKEICPSGDEASFFATNEKTGLVMSGFLEKVSLGGTSKECRDHYWEKAKQSPFKKDDIKMSDFGQMAIVEYIVKEHQGIELNQKNLNAYLAKGNYWIDIHLSKPNYQAPDEILFKSILQNIRINEIGNKQKTVIHYRIPGHGVLMLNVSKSWCDEMSQPPDEMPPTIIFNPKSKILSKIMITVFWITQEKVDYNRPEQIKSLIKSKGEDLLSQAVEKDLNIQELRGSSVGYYFTLTDKAPKPGECKYLTQGGYGVGDLFLFFSIFTNEANSTVIQEALKMIADARQLLTIKNR